MARSQRLQILLKPEIMNKLKELAKSLGLPAGTIGAHAIGEYLLKNERSE